MAVSLDAAYCFTVSLRELAKFPLILTDQSLSWQHIVALFNAGGLEVDVAARASSFELQRSMVANGLPVALGKGPTGVVADGAGGALIACAIVDTRGFDTEYYVQRFTFSGTLSPGWPAEGVRTW